MDNSTIEILVEMQKTEPTGTEKRSCRKVSFAAPALHKHCYLTFNASQNNFVFAFRPHQNTQFSEDFSVLPPFVPMDAFEQVKNSGKSMKKLTNAAVVINSNDKGLRMVNFFERFTGV